MNIDSTVHGKKLLGSEVHTHTHSTQPHKVKKNAAVLKVQSDST